MKTLKIKFLYGIIFVVVIIMFSPLFLYAENISGLYDGDINVETIPENPQPYENVTIILSSYATDLNKAMIEWENESKVLLSGYGKTSYSFKTLGPDSSVYFNIKITPTGYYQPIIKNVGVNTSEVELLWEAVDGYTPPFYKGKSFVSREGAIKVVAIPNTRKTSSIKGKVTYNWKRDGDSVLSASGYNKNSYVFMNKELNPTEKVTVTASSLDNQYNATKTIEIPTISPKIIFYKKSPTEGVLYNKALVDDDYLVGEEMTIVAEPYFLAIKGKEGIFDYTWKINGDPIKTPIKKTELTVAPTSRGGYANISLTLENFNTLFQKVIGQLKISL